MFSSLTGEQERLLIALAEKHGNVDPRALWKAAKADPNHPFHNGYDWNQKRAAEAHWDDVSCRYIRMAKWLHEESSPLTYTPPRFVRDPEDRKNRTYISIPHLSNDEDKARTVVVEEFKRAANALGRAKAIAAALGMTDEIEKAMIQINALIDHVQQPAKKPGRNGRGRPRTQH